MSYEIRGIYLDFLTNGMQLQPGHSYCFAWNLNLVVLDPLEWESDRILYRYTTKG